jgi:glycosyltransferase involved in cell wall biosynthesis
MRSSQTERPKISIVVVLYNMAREAPRTLFSLSAAFQRNVRADDYEVIVVDNGSTPAFDPQVLAGLDGNFRLIRIDSAPPSPVHAINCGVADARGDLIGVMIDGARIVSPGVVGLAAMAGRLSERIVALTLGFHLGPKVQMQSVPEGYNQDEEDRLLARSGWREDGYRLFDISVFAGSSTGGWFRPISESNGVFMPRGLWDELGGYDERFTSPGGGYVNLDTRRRVARCLIRHPHWRGDVPSGSWWRRDQRPGRRAGSLPYGISDDQRPAVPDAGLSFALSRHGAVECAGVDRQIRARRGTER